MIEMPITKYCVFRYTLKADVGEYLTICSGINRSIDVPVPNTVTIVENIKNEFSMAIIPITSAPNFRAITILKMKLNPTEIV